MGFGTEVLFMIILGLVVLGPKRLHTVLQHVAQMRADFEKASRGVKSQLAAELEGVPQNLKTEFTNSENAEDKKPGRVGQGNPGLGREIPSPAKDNSRRRIRAWPT
jgi:Sec-independent protein translocase protein TatA